MSVTMVGLDLVKPVFQVHEVNDQGQVLSRKRRRHQPVAAFFANLPGCWVRMEGCASAY